MLPPQPRRTGARKSGGLGAEARRRAVARPGVELLLPGGATTSLDLLRDGRRGRRQVRPGRRGSHGPGAAPAWLSLLRAREAPAAGQKPRRLEGAPSLRGAARAGSAPPVQPSPKEAAAGVRADRAEPRLQWGPGSPPRRGRNREGAVFNPGPAGSDGKDGQLTPREARRATAQSHLESGSRHGEWAAQAPSPFPSISPESVPSSAAMKRQLPAGQSCISRHRLLLPLLLLLFLHLAAAELRGQPVQSRRGARLSLPRKPWDSNHHSTWLPKRLSKNSLSWLAQKQTGMADSLLLLRELLRPRLDPLQLGYGPLPQPALMPALRRKRRAAQLMRVGCALGTCQVQNLSHRLWQLKGQLGRQDSSPISLHSPHSYG
ncbi:protein ADM2 [Thamnophis elegans]|uniref:protein ADM2 n=1 Tax=Thamnophis elegans TaxID=35005 RepID=UPI001378F567|nr:protein ADM2 [Thamnophis elegans]